MDTLELLWQCLAAKLGHLSSRDEKMLQVLISQRLAVHGKQNFTNIARYLPVHEQTLRLWFEREINWNAIHLALCELTFLEPPILASLDATYISKAGKKTFGLGKFWDGCQQRAHRGLEISVLALTDPETGQTMAFDVRQTPAHLPAQPQTETAETTKPTYSRLDVNLKALENLPKSVTHIAFDGYYAKIKTFDKAKSVGKYVVTKLRKDARLRDLATDAERAAHREKQPRGAPLKYGAFIDWKSETFETWESIVLTDEGKETIRRLRRKVIYSPHFKRKLNVLYVEYQNGSQALLVTDDLTLKADDLFRYYHQRFQIEFLFRDAKQFSGLTEEQTRKEKSLHFHFNLSLAAVNFARYAMATTQTTKSMHDFRRLVQNKWLVDFIISNYDPEAEFGLNPKTRQKITEMGCIHKS